MQTHRTLGKAGRDGILHLEIPVNAQTPSSRSSSCSSRVTPPPHRRPPTTSGGRLISSSRRQAQSRIRRSDATTRGNSRVGRISKWRISSIRIRASNTSGSGIRPSSPGSPRRPRGKSGSAPSSRRSDTAPIAANRCRKTSSRSRTSCTPSSASPSRTMRLASTVGFARPGTPGTRHRPARPADCRDRPGPRPDTRDPQYQGVPQHLRRIEPGSLAATTLIEGRTGT